MNPTRPASPTRRLLAAAAVATAALPLAAFAQAKWPEKPVRMLVAGPAGGSADILARLLGDHLAKDIGQPVIVEPKPGAGGILAVNELSQAPRDGHTLLVAVNSLVSEIPHIVKTKVDMSREIVPLAELARGGLVLVGNPAVPAKTLPELVAYVKGNPGKVNVASYTAGTLSHVLGLQLNKAAGIDLVHVGYKGSTPALQDVMGGHVPLMFDGIPTSLPLLKAGRIKAFAVSTPKRSALLPEVPTFAELGYPQLEAIAWMGLWCKPEVPAALQQRVRDAALKALGQAGVRERLAEVGFEPGQPRAVDELSKSLRVDYERMGTLLKAIDFKPE
ncbi:tripartite tricarboxylate transporter substrate binding protein [Aquincola sp. S2]|uniref:Tripartite tricarboxylate transporter substrate binding protein n=1 Tax=Pseudaquabacterium terrae TaxID=2732868 RepID=A0ABX2EF24_9BURK|nr:tripartite tricarboxylate transporter substrate binding protein [Aquabacterium terrae]NRF67218.1 tripartite tricarboxylate transporter substrate binding protein [Aquabacterium terrae]